MLKVRAAAVLETMWGDSKGRRSPRWFRINPLNHTGKRLYWFLGHNDLLVTNVCPLQVANARQHGKPDKAWLEENLKKIQYDLLLICGKVAQDSVKIHMVNSDSRLVWLPHPAARNWTKEKLQSYKDYIQSGVH